jgi:hypothetical protein
MRPQPEKSAMRTALLALAGSAMILTQTRGSLVDLGTNSFLVDIPNTSALYTQSSSSLTFSSIAFGDLLSGYFKTEQDWSAYSTFGLSMSVLGLNPDIPLSLELYDSTFNVVNSYQAFTTGLPADGSPGISMLSRTSKGTGDMSKLAGMTLTWNSGATNTNTTIFNFVGYSQATTGFFVARAPGGVEFITGEDYVTSLAPSTSIWDPPTSASAGVSLPKDGVAWAMLSDRNAKADIREFDHRLTLRKIEQLPVTSWHYTHNPSRLHIGPMAQDFHHLFGLGNDDKRINTADTDGVVLSALKGLIAELKERKKRTVEQSERLRALQEELDSLQGQLTSKSLPPAGPLP